MTVRLRRPRPTDRLDESPIALPIDAVGLAASPTAVNLLRGPRRTTAVRHVSVGMPIGRQTTSVDRRVVATTQP